MIPWRTSVCTHPWHHNDLLLLTVPSNFNKQKLKGYISTEVAHLFFSLRWCCLLRSGRQDGTSALASLRTPLPTPTGDQTLRPTLLGQNSTRASPETTVWNLGWRQPQSFSCLFTEPVSVNFKLLLGTLNAYLGTLKLLLRTMKLLQRTLKMLLGPLKLFYWNMEVIFLEHGSCFLGTLKLLLRTLKMHFGPLKLFSWTIEVVSWNVEVTPTLVLFLQKSHWLQG